MMHHRYGSKAKAYHRLKGDDTRRQLSIELLEDRCMLANSVLTPPGELLTTPSANFNGDTIISGADFLIWQRSHGLDSFVTHENGDADHDGDADADDLAVLQAQYGQSFTPVDLSIAKSARETSLLTNQPVTYTITVTNNATSDIAGATVVDVLPPELVNASWTAELSGGGVADLSGTGDINTTIDLAAGSSITYTLTASVIGTFTTAQATYQVTTNAAHVCGPEGTVDVDPSDNSSIDSDIVLFDAVGGTSQFQKASREFPQSSPVDEYLLGDVDGDLDLDVVASGSGSSIWLNDGLGNYTKTAQSFAKIHALHDFDGDGFLDILIGTDRLVVRFNDGTGIFLPPDNETLPESLSWRIEELVATDLDGDGDLDAVATGDAGVHALWNDGTGGFSSNTTLLSDSRVYEFFLPGDFDGDGDLDFLTWADIHINQGGAVFATEQHGMDFRSSSYIWLDVGDVDNDGSVDLIASVSDHDTNLRTLKVWRNDGSGNFAIHSQTASSKVRERHSFKLGDLDDDGDLDVFIAVEQGYAVVDHNRVDDKSNEVWLNDGSGTFRDSEQTLGDSETTTVALGDLDGDGDLDALVANRDNINFVPAEIFFNADTDLAVDITNATSSVKEDQQISYTITVTNEGPADVVGAVVTDEFPKELENVTWTADIQGGGTAAIEGAGNIIETIDLENGSSIVYTVSANLVGSLTPNQSVERILSNSVSVVAPADVLEADPSDNRDTDSDVIVLKATAGTAQFRGKGEGIEEGFERVDALGDLDGDGDLDAVIRTRDNWAAIVLNDGFGSFSAPIASFESIDTVALGDMDNDGDLDLVFSAYPRAILPVWLNNGSAQFTPLENQSLLRFFALEISLADFNADGTLDVLYSNGSSPNLGVYLNDGTGMLSHLEEADLSLGSVSLGDVDGDGDVDVLSSRSNNFPVVTLLINDGEGVLSESPQSFGSFHNQVAELGDVDGDGDLDAFVLSRPNALPEGHRVWLNDGFGAFTDSGQALLFEVEGAPTAVSGSLKLGDFDGDGDLDAIIGSQQNFLSDTSQVWLNDGQGNYSFSSEETSTRSFTSYAKFALGDLDGDGDLDLIDQYARGGEPIFLNGAPIDLAVSYPDQPSYVVEGETVYYSLRVDNLGDVDVVGATVENHFDINLLSDIRLNGTTSQGGASSQQTPGPLGNSLSDTVNLPAGASITYEISAELIGPLTPNQAVKKQLTTTARVFAPEQPFEETNLTNNVSVNTDIINLAAAGSAAQFVAGPLLPPNVNPLAAGDLDGDGDLDAIVESRDGARVWINDDGLGTMVEGEEFTVYDFYRRDYLVADFASLGDLDGDGDLDVLVASHLRYDTFYSMWLNNGDGTFIRINDVPWQPRFLTPFSDLDGDGDLDMLVSEDGGAGLVVWLNDGDASFTRGAQLEGPFASPRGHEFADLDGDGDVDIWLGGEEIWLNDGRGSFTPIDDAVDIFSHADGGSEFLDFDGNGDLDFLAFDEGDTYAYRNDGNGAFSRLALFFNGYTRANDFDGDPDLLIAEERELWLNDGVGNFFPTTIAPIFGSDSIAGDFDGDGDLDILTGISYLWLNEPHPSTADFDQDADIDGQDFLAWQRGYGLANPQATKADGDADNDFDVDAEDLAVWLASYAGTEAPVITSVISDELQAVNTIGLLIDAALALSGSDDSTKVESDFVEDQTFVALKPKSQFVSTARGLADDPEHEVDFESASSSETDRHDQSWLAEELLERVFSQAAVCYRKNPSYQARI